MPLFHILILSFIQAATEFLPVSSSGHLVLLHKFWGGADAWGDALIMDLAVHVGTLLAVLVYYRRDIAHMIRAGLMLLTRAPETAADRGSRRLAFFLIMASLPALAVGLVLEILEPQWLRSVHVVAFTMPVFGILLWWVDAQKPATRDVSSMSFKEAMLIGFAQVLALVPGTSRSGITMTTARWQGFARIEAARFSFLLSIVATSAAGAIGALRLVQSGDLALAGQAFLALVFTFFAALAVIHWLMRFLGRYSFKVFGIYRIILGCGLIALIYAGVLA
jgi:undecaprenyl-diphosphatase